MRRRSRLTEPIGLAGHRAEACLAVTAAVCGSVRKRGDSQTPLAVGAGDYLTAHSRLHPEPDRGRQSTLLTKVSPPSISRTVPLTWGQVIRKTAA